MSLKLASPLSENEEEMFKTLERAFSRSLTNETFYCKTKGHTIIVQAFSSGFLCREHTPSFKLLPSQGFVCTNGGAKFYHTEDKRHIAKLTDVSETGLLLKKAKSYIEYTLSNPDTLLCRYECMVESSHARCSLLVMENGLFGCDNARAYDLKGVLRTATNNRNCFKEREWIRLNRRIVLSDNDYFSLLTRLERDVSFLVSHYVIDYSLVVSETQDRNGRNVVVSKDGRAYKIVIVDLLTEYGVLKRLERFFTCILCMQRSCIEPVSYGKRMLAFIKRHMLERERIDAEKETVVLNF